MAVLRYSLLRLGLFLLATALAWWALRSWLAPVVGAFAAWGLSYVLLPGPRDAAAAQIADRVEARKARGAGVVLTGGAADDAQVEDEADEAARRTPPSD